MSERSWMYIRRSPRQRSQIASASVPHNSREEILLSLAMISFSLVLALASAALAAPSGGHYEYGYQQKHCHTKQRCHQEYDTIVDTTYIEECQDIVTQHCQQTSQQVHHSSAVVGHDSHVVSHGHGGYHGKREAEAEPGYGGYSSGPQCQQHVEKQCHKVPQQHQRQVPRQVCVPYEVCGHSHVHQAQYSSGHHGYHH